jgi:hypothetical protein
MSAEGTQMKTLYEGVSIPGLLAPPELDLQPSVEKAMSDMEVDLRFMFREAVADSLANLLDESEARALVALMGGTSLEDPGKVYGALDSILQMGSHVLKDAIAEEFHAKVDLLKRRLAEDPDSIIWVAKFVQMMEGNRRLERRE